jgi:hypothetical protein
MEQSLVAAAAGFLQTYHEAQRRLVGCCGRRKRPTAFNMPGGDPPDFLHLQPYEVG